MVAARTRRADTGFSYLGLLFAIALSAGAMAVAATLSSTEAKREREAQLLFAGDQIRAAIAAYHDQAPVGANHVFPKSFDDLIEDKRWPVKRRHLRKLYADPMSGRADWGLVLAPDGGIMGVHSHSAAPPLKRGRFPAAYNDFAEAASYRDWRFVHVPSADPPAGPRPRRPVLQP